MPLSILIDQLISYYDELSNLHMLVLGISFYRYLLVITAELELSLLPVRFSIFLKQTALLHGGSLKCA